MTLRAPLTSLEMSTQERVETEGGPEEMNNLIELNLNSLLNHFTVTSTLVTQTIMHITCQFYQHYSVDKIGK